MPQVISERFLNADTVDLMCGSFARKLTCPRTSVTKHKKTKTLHPIPSGAALKIYERDAKYVY